MVNVKLDLTYAEAVTLHKALAALAKNWQGLIFSNLPDNPNNHRLSIVEQKLSEGIRESTNQYTQEVAENKKEPNA